MNYWKECIIVACDEANINLTSKEINFLSKRISDAYDVYGESTGILQTSYKSDTELKLQALKREQRRKEKWLYDTIVCRNCFGEGTIIDCWGCNVICMNCNGAGRVNK